MAVGATALATGYLAAAYGLRPVPELIGVAYAAAGLALSVLVVRDTAAHVAAETASHPGPGQQSAPADSGPAAGTAVATRKPFSMIFLDTSWRNLSLRGASQAGLVNNLNDGLTWGVFPQLFASRGLVYRRGGRRRPGPPDPPEGPQRASGCEYIRDARCVPPGVGGPAAGGAPHGHHVPRPHTHPGPAGNAGVRVYGYLLGDWPAPAHHRAPARASRLRAAISLFPAPSALLSGRTGCGKARLPLSHPPPHEWERT
jgi:hypothetical protein